jgi:uncharacterized protein
MSASEVTPNDSVQPRRILLCWDAPNMDMALSAVVGGKPSASHRPDWVVLHQWLRDRAEEASQETGQEVLAEACVFINVATGAIERIRPWVDGLRRSGFAVFARPKVTHDSDIDADILAHVRRRHDEGVLHELYIASGDKKAFQETLETLSRQGVPTHMLGFLEVAMAPSSVSFVDLEAIKGLFRKPLPRLGLDRLPDEGAWLPPFAPVGRDRRFAYPGTASAVSTSTSDTDE